ncbi:helix-turn-helix domain-containing protein [Mangrovihabitans endophyticus]|uniref:helix-turn-helix domain-containing protein n=1 Tax=Mangrovihabitans endophyticus TaxID=1751298 RepID=UPI00166BB1E2|nr:helix-turn-helix transcriptional regulator [Mangrovihabitans endophyticus]
MSASESVPSPCPSTAERIGWLLRSNRVHGGDSRWTRAKHFALAFPGGAWPAGMHESTISRWETGTVLPPSSAVRRYEELLGVASGNMATMVETVRRFTANPGDDPYLPDRLGNRADLDELLERALSRATMTGAHWDALSARIAATPQLVLAPRATRAELAERLLREMIISHGVPWRRRFEALNRLLDHPSCGPEAVAACASLAADRTNQVFIETVGVLDASAHPDAARHVLAQLAHPTNDRALTGALLACLRKIRFGHFTADQLGVLAGHIAELRDDPVHQADARPVAALLRRRAPHLHRRPVPAGPARAAVPARGPGLSFDESALAMRIAEAAGGAAGADTRTGMRGDIFAHLVAETLFHPVSDARLYSAMLVSATPHREGLAAALADELSRAATDRTGLGTRLVAALRTLGGAEQRPLLEGIVTGPGWPDPLVKEATFGVGHLGCGNDPGFWRAALGAQQQRFRRGTAGADALTGTVYSIGVAGQRAVLADLSRDAEVCSPVRAAAAWWLDIPEHLYASVRR